MSTPSTDNNVEHVFDAFSQANQNVSYLYFLANQNLDAVDEDLAQDQKVNLLLSQAQINPSNSWWVRHWEVSLLLAGFSALSLSAFLLQWLSYGSLVLHFTWSKIFLSAFLLSLPSTLVALIQNVINERTLSKIKSALDEKNTSDPVWKSLGLAPPNLVPLSGKNITDFHDSLDHTSQTAKELWLGLLKNKIDLTHFDLQNLERLRDAEKKLDAIAPKQDNDLTIDIDDVDSVREKILAQVSLSALNNDDRTIG